MIRGGDETAGTYRKTSEGHPHVAVALWKAGSRGSEVCRGLEGRTETEAEDVEEGRILSGKT